LPISRSFWPFRFEQGEDGDLDLKLFDNLQNPISMPNNLAQPSQVSAFRFEQEEGLLSGVVCGDIFASFQMDQMIRN
jgi:hypothetical protein